MILPFLKQSSSHNEDEEEDSLTVRIYTTFLGLTLQAVVPWFLAITFSLLVIFVLRTPHTKLVEKKGNEEDDEEEAEEEQQDISVMLIVPFIAFLSAESANLSGYLVLFVTAFTLALYGKGNMNAQRAETLSDILRSGSYIFKTLCYLLMGVSLPLHFESAKQTINSFMLAIGIICVPLVGFLTSAFVNKVFKLKELSATEKRIVHFEQASSTGLVAYLLALQSFHFKVMHFVLIQACFSFLVSENLAGIYLSYSMKNELGEPNAAQSDKNDNSLKLPENASRLTKSLFDLHTYFLKPKLIREMPKKTEEEVSTKGSLMELKDMKGKREQNLED